MNDRRAVLPSLLLACLAASSVVAAGPRRDEPRAYVPVLDGAPVGIDLPAEGTSIVAWAYRSGSEYDLAVSVRDPFGSWDTPLILGVGDRVDQVDPALAVDEGGTAYLVYALRPAGGLFLTVRRAGGATWSAPAQVVPAEARASLPAIRVVGGRVIIAFRSARVTSIVDVPLAGEGASTQGIQDGPDGVDPIGASEEEPGSPLGGG